MLYNIVITPIETIIDWVFLFITRKFEALGIIGAVFGVSIAMNFMALPIYNVADALQEKERNIAKRLSKQVKRIKETFKGDEQFMMLQAYYKEEHYHPLYVFRSSLSILIEIPFFIAAYHYLSHCPSLFGASFWIFKNLGEADKLFSLTFGTKIFYINVLPILMTLINFASGAIYTKGAPIKEKVQLYGVAVVFLVLLYNSPSGLVIYWILNNLFSLVKNIVLKLKKPGRIVHAFISLVFIFLTAFYFKNKPGTSLWKKELMLFGTILFCLIPLFSYFIKKLNLNRFFRSEKIEEPIRKREKIAFSLTLITLSVLLGFTLPASVISSSPTEFSFLGNVSSPLFYVKTAFFVFGGFCILWPLVIYNLFDKKVKRGEAILFFAVLVTTLFNIYVFKPNYGPIDARFSVTNRLDRVPFYFYIIPIFIFALSAFCFYILQQKKKLQFVSVILFSVLISEFSLGIIKTSSIKKEFNEYAKQHEKMGEDKILSKENINKCYNFSKTQNNVLVIFLDRAVSQFFPYIEKQFPEMEDEFSGFSYYPNTLSFGTFTIFGFPEIMGGYEYTQLNMNKRKDELLKDKHNEALLVLPKLFSDKGYSVTYSNPTYPNYKWKGGTSFFDDYPYVNAFELRGTLSEIYKSEKNIDSLNNLDKIANHQIVNFVFLEGLYPLIRHVFHRTVQDNSVMQDDFIDNFSDLYYLKELTQFESEKPTFTFIGNETPHAPTSLESPDYETLAPYKTGSTGFYKAYNQTDGMEYQALAASLKQLGKFFNYLKENNVYDNTRIIIVSDHGYFNKYNFSNDFKDKTVLSSFNPLFMVKDFNSTGKLKTNNSLMTNADTLFFAKEGLSLSDKNPFTHRTFVQEKENIMVWEPNKEEWSSTYVMDKTQFTLEKGYKITENIFNPNNWKEINYKDLTKDTKEGDSDNE
ncbi:MAG: YidC/Oxa1 family membrane protein insertase [Treponema sp.]|nr:YidC/Oxa1 family membrane protein insertase [Treponema sp.]